MNLTHLGTALLLVFASSGCGNNDDDASFSYGVGEMRSAIEGRWEGSSRTSAAGTDAPMTMTIAYVAPGSRPLCGNRLLSHDAPGTVRPRCVDMSSVNVSGTILTSFGAGEAAQEIPVKGTFDVMSLHFDGGGTLRVDADGRTFDATLSGDVLEGSLRANGGTNALTFSVRRRK